MQGKSFMRLSINYIEDYNIVHCDAVFSVQLSDLSPSVSVVQLPTPPPVSLLFQTEILTSNLVLSSRGHQGWPVHYHF